MDKKNFLEALAEKIKSAELPKASKTSGAQIAAMLGASPEVFIAGELTESIPQTGGSKIGGRPDVEATFEWPHEQNDDEAPLQFIAQFNLAEIKPYDFDGRLPPTGMVWFFSIADGDRAYGGEIDSSTTRVVFSRKPGLLAPRDIPEELAAIEDATIKERGLVFGPTVSTAALADSGHKAIVKSAAQALGARHGPVFVLNAMDDAGEPTFMLADFDMYRIARNAFGEGILGFALTEGDLVKGALENAYTVFQSGT